MSNNYIKLYSIGSDSECVYFLNQGSVYFYASNDDKYVINGKKLILGASEIILNNVLHKSTKRIETALSDHKSIIKKISVDKFLEGLNSFSFLLNVSMVLAKQVMLTNKIINLNMSKLSSDERLTKELATEYYTIIKRLKEEFHKRKFPWLKELIKKYEINLTYKRGEAYFKTAEPVKLTNIVETSDHDNEYSRGDVICEENTLGEEMYVLQSGSLDVVINKNRVATINEPGTIIGEMALLLGEKRSATLIAKNNVVICKVNRAELKKLSESGSDILHNIVYSLAKRHYFNIIKIGSVNQSLIEQNLNEEEQGKAQNHSIKAKSELNSLKSSIESIAKEKSADFINDLL